GAEGGLQDTGSCAADAQSVGKANVQSVAGGVLLHGDEAGHALAGLVLRAHRVAGALGGDHDDVDILGGLDAAEVDVEAVGKGQGLALGEVGLDALFIQGRLLFVVDKNHDDVGGFGGLGGGHDGET